MSGLCSRGLNSYGLYIYGQVAIIDHARYDSWPDGHRTSFFITRYTGFLIAIFFIATIMLVFDVPSSQVPV